MFTPGMGFAKDHALLRSGRVGANGALDLNKRSAGVDLHIRHDHDFPDSSGKRRDDLRLHFHGFEHGDAVADSDGVPHVDRDGNDHRWSRSMHHASVVAVHLMRHGVHVDTRTYSLAD